MSTIALPAGSQLHRPLFPAPEVKAPAGTPSSSCKFQGGVGWGSDHRLCSLKTNSEVKISVQKVHWGVVLGSSPLAEKGKKQDWARKKLGYDAVSVQGSANPHEENGPSLSPLATPYMDQPLDASCGRRRVMTLGEPTLPS